MSHAQVFGVGRLFAAVHFAFSLLFAVRVAVNSVPDPDHRPLVHGESFLRRLIFVTNNVTRGSVTPLVTHLVGICDNWRYLRPNSCPPDRF